MNLPKGCTVVDQSDDRTYVEIDPAVAYPPRIKELGLEMDQFGLEAARMSLQREMKDAIGPLHVRILRRDEMRLVNHPAGRGAEAGASQFRSYHKRMMDRRKEG